MLLSQLIPRPQFTSSFLFGALIRAPGADFQEACCACAHCVALAQTWLLTWCLGCTTGACLLAHPCPPVHQRSKDFVLAPLERCLSIRLVLQCSAVGRHASVLVSVHARECSMSLGCTTFNMCGPWPRGLPLAYQCTLYGTALGLGLANWHATVISKPFQAVLRVRWQMRFGQLLT